MFLYQLNLPEKMAFLQLAKELVIVDDNKIDSEEMSMLILMCNEMQISINDVYSIEFSLELLAKQFKDDISQRICITELILLAYSNGNYHPSQNILISSLQNIFNFEESEINQIESWVTKLSSIFKEGIQLIERKS
jgi:hypothetical protein